MPGPGLEALRLFTMQSEEIRTEELENAVSVLPLGISRAEVQDVFRHLGGSRGSPNTILFEQFAAAAESAYLAGVPADALLERIDTKRLSAALQRLSSPAR